MSLEPTAQMLTVTFGRTAMGVFRSSSFLLSKALIALLIVVEFVSPAVSLTLPMAGSRPRKDIWITVQKNKRAS